MLATQADCPVVPNFKSRLLVSPVNSISEKMRNYDKHSSLLFNVAI